MGRSRSDRPLRRAAGLRPRLFPRRGRADPRRCQGLRRRVRPDGACLTDAGPGRRDRRRIRRRADDAGRRPSPLVLLEREPGMSEMTYLEAISDGLRTEMRRDESVFCIGEDIGAFGGAFKVTNGFLEEFGADRVLDTPLAENAIIGAAVGAAV